MGVNFPKPGRRPWMMVVAAVVLVLAGLNLWRQAGGKPDTTGHVWYYDLRDGALFPGDPQRHPPIEAPSGAEQGVRAVVYTCDSCSEAERKIVYLESNTPQAKKILENMPSPAEQDVSALVMQAQTGARIAAAPAPGTAPAWVSAVGPDADAIRTAASRMCGSNVPPRQCYP